MGAKASPDPSPVDPIEQHAAYRRRINPPGRRQQLIDQRINPRDLFPTRLVSQQSIPPQAIELHRLPRNHARSRSSCPGRSTPQASWRQPPPKHPSQAKYSWRQSPQCRPSLRLAATPTGAVIITRRMIHPRTTDLALAHLGPILALIGSPHRPTRNHRQSQSSREDDVVPDDPESKSSRIRSSLTAFASQCLAFTLLLQAGRLRRSMPGHPSSRLPAPTSRTHCRTEMPAFSGRLHMPSFYAPSTGSMWFPPGFERAPPR